jgi:hypothetical protein
VARKNNDVVVERQYPLSHALHQLLKAAAREIGPTDRTSKQLVSREKNFFVGHPETNMSRSVSGCVNHLNIDTGEPDYLPVDEGLEIGYRERFGQSDSHEGLNLSVGVQAQVVVIGMDVRLDPIVAGDLAGGSPMINMTMGNQQRHRGNIERSDELDDRVNVRRSIDDEPRPTAFDSDHVRVGLGNP